MGFTNPECLSRREQAVAELLVTAAFPKLVPAPTPFVVAVLHFVTACFACQEDTLHRMGKSGGQYKYVTRQQAGMWLVDTNPAELTSIEGSPVKVHTLSYSIIELVASICLRLPSIKKGTVTLPWNW